MEAEARGNLLVSRYEGQRVRLLLPDGKIVWLTVVETEAGRGRVRLAIEAELSVVIDREELLPLAERYQGRHPKAGRYEGEM